MSDAARGIILFDGVCHFCAASVQFIIQRDPAGAFCFASQQSQVGRDLLKQHGLPDSLDTFVLIIDQEAFTRSTAALKVAGGLSGPWWLFGVFWLLPRPIRDGVYQIIARNRYRWFGRRETCWVPTPEIRARFLDASAS